MIVLCDKHLGEAHPPRCAECDAIAVQARAATSSTSRRTAREQITNYEPDPDGDQITPAIRRFARQAAAAVKNGDRAGVEAAFHKHLTALRSGRHTLGIQPLDDTLPGLDLDHLPTDT